MVLLISAEGKKWGSHYHHTGNGGKMWGKMFMCECNKRGERDCPHLNETPDKLTNPKKVIPNPNVDKFFRKQKCG